MVCKCKLCKEQGDWKFCADHNGFICEACRTGICAKQGHLIGKNKLDCNEKLREQESHSH